MSRLQPVPVKGYHVPTVQSSPYRDASGVMTDLRILLRQAAKAQCENHLGRDIGRNVYYIWLLKLRAP